MENSTKLYWLTRLDSLQGFCIGSLILSCVILLFYWLIYSTRGEYSSDEKETLAKSEFKRKYGKKATQATFLGIISSAILALAPTRAELIFIVAGGKTMDFIEKDKSIQALPSQTTELVSKYLDKKIKEIEDADKK